MNNLAEVHRLLGNCGHCLTFVSPKAGGKSAGEVGRLAGGLPVALDAPGPLVGAVAAACGLAFLGVSVTLAVRQAQRLTRGYVSMLPGPGTTSSGRGDSQAVAEEGQT
jgi:hypothetical protein